jgi:hypothetical protein
VLGGPNDQTSLDVLDVDLSFNIVAGGFSNDLALVNIAGGYKPVALLINYGGIYRWAKYFSNAGSSFAALIFSKDFS